MKAIAASLAGLLLLPIFVIAAMGEAMGEDFDPGSQGAASESPHSGGADSYPSSASRGELEQRVLFHPNIRLGAGARRDVEMSRTDRRILQILLILADRHHLGYVGPIATGHSYFVKGTTRVSNHVYGRAVDISVIDGRPVSESNERAYAAARTVASLEPPLRPSELGAPWRVPSEGVYSWTDDAHKDHLHIGFRE